MVLNKERKEFINVTKNQVELERMILRVSYQDAMLLNNSLQFQLEQLGSGKEEEEKSEEEKKRLEEEKKKMERIESRKKTMKRQNMTSTEEFKSNEAVQELDAHFWKDNLEEYHLDSAGFQIVVINDAHGILVPIRSVVVEIVIVKRIRKNFSKRSIDFIFLF